MNTSAIREKLYEYIKKAEDKKVRAIYTIIEGDLNEMEKWQDDQFIADLEKRSLDLKEGKDKGISWKELKNELTDHNTDSD